MKRKIHELLAMHPALQPIFYSIQGAIPPLAGKVAPRTIAYPSSNMLIVAGAGRSGNTLLRRLLVERAEIYIPPETYVLGSIVATLLKNKRLCWEEQVNLSLGAFEYHPEFVTFGLDSLKDFAGSAKHWPPSRQQVGTLIYELYVWLAYQKGIRATWVGDKTPMNTLQLGLIDKLFPMGRYIYMERDPFDVVSSYVRAGIYNNYVEAADRWLLSRKAWKSFRSRIEADKCCEIKFEDLVRLPHQVITQVLRKFDIPERESPLDVTRLLGDVGLRKHHEQVFGGITTISIGVARKTLPPQARIDLAKRLNAEATAAGYAPL